MAAKEIKIKYFSKDYPELRKIGDKNSDWIDLRADTIIEHHSECEISPQDDTRRYFAGDVLKVGLGVAMELPEGYEAIVAARSSTFKHWGLIQTNGIGVIDGSYKGDSDEWMIEFIAMRGGVLNRHDRVCQFRIQENQPQIDFHTVEELGNKDRGGYGESGKGSDDVE